ncbi:hypothetical protein BDZ91DRAFT_729006 [Kalaharituber pfeilii]|nr:hypothetical protein BDZ91DRAFT_729006 [Kalaharituber pfeilii]
MFTPTPQYKDVSKIWNNASFASFTTSLLLPVLLQRIPRLIQPRLIEPRLIQRRLKPCLPLSRLQLSLFNVCISSPCPRNHCCYAGCIFNIQSRESFGSTTCSYSSTSSSRVSTNCSSIANSLENSHFPNYNFTFSRTKLQDPVSNSIWYPNLT